MFLITNVSALLLSLYTYTTSYLISLGMISLVMSKQRREFSIKYAPEYDLYYLYVLEACLTHPASLCSPHDRIDISTSFYSVFFLESFFFLCASKSCPNNVIYKSKMSKILPIFIELKKYAQDLPMVSLMSFWFIHPNFIWVQHHLQPNGNIR